MRKAWTAFAVVVALAAAPAGAQAKKESEAERTEKALRGSKGRYGDAGCGLGSMAFGTDPGAVQILASTTNTIFLTQFFGITSGTSNCHGLSGGTQASIFIEANREALAKDISRGSGETIGTLSWIAGCEDARAVGATLQRSFTAIFPSETVSSEAVTATILQALKDDAALACRNLG